MRDSPSLFLALLAGGRGTRFWPLSRERMPKQFLRLGSDKSLLQEARERYAPFVSASRTLIVAGELYTGLIRQQLPEIPPGNLLVEPSPRDTAPAVGLAALEVRRRNPRAVLAVSPSDHRIADMGGFHEALARATRRAWQGGLGTLGVTPDRPATSFGYLSISSESESEGSRRVKEFVEKPDSATAARYLVEGNILWNAGIFIFRVDVFFEALSTAAPRLAEGLERLERARSAEDPGAVSEAWASLPKTSIDYALMERAPDVWTVTLDAGWDDVGSWASAEKSLSRDEKGNAATAGETLFLDAARTTVFAAGRSGTGRAIVLIGIEDLIVVDTEDVLLVCRRDRCEEVKKAVEEFRNRGREDLL